MICGQGLLIESQCFYFPFNLSCSSLELSLPLFTSERFLNVVVAPIITEVFNQSYAVQEENYSFFIMSRSFYNVSTFADFKT